MASIRKELDVNADATTAWALLRSAGDAQEAFKPVLTDARLEQKGRIVTFANGMVLHEDILDVDDVRRRIAYSVKDAPGLAYHHASMEVVARGQGTCRFIWITDFLPAEASSMIAPLVEAGANAFKSNVEAR